MLLRGRPDWKMMLLCPHHQTWILSSRFTKSSIFNNSLKWVMHSLSYHFIWLHLLHHHVVLIMWGTHPRKAHWWCLSFILLKMLQLILLWWHRLRLIRWCGSNLFNRKSFESPTKEWMTLFFFLLLLRMSERFHLLWCSHILSLSLTLIMALDLCNILLVNERQVCFINRSSILLWRRWLGWCRMGEWLLGRILL